LAYSDCDFEGKSELMGCAPKVGHQKSGHFNN
jgi:hypothetical protein